MNNQKSNRVKGYATARYIVLALVLLLSACDGGIFGTGGPDDMLDNNAMNTVDAAPIPTNGSESGATNANTADSQEGDVSASTDDTATDSTDTTDAADTVDSTDSVDSDTMAPTDAVFMENTVIDKQFTNATTTLSGTDATINVINTSSLTVNVIDTGVQNTPLLFDTEGVATNTNSSGVTLQQNQTSLDVVDNNTRAEVVARFTEFNAANETFTTLLIRQNDAQIDAIPLITETTTTDSSQIKVRVIQAGTLGEASFVSTFNLLSTGSNTDGAVDRNFGPLSFDMPVSEYTEIFSGDYVLSDANGRIDNQTLSFEAGNVYTVVVVNNSSDGVLLVNDTEAAGL